MRLRRDHVPILRLAPEIWKYQAVTKLILAAVLAVLRGAALILIRSTGRPAVTSGDLLALAAVWQGPVLLLLAVTALFFCVAIDLNVKILYSADVLDGVTGPTLSTVKRAAAAMPRFFNVHGLGVVLYVSLIAPLAGSGLGISLTEDLRVPGFIRSVIDGDPVYAAAWTALVLIFTAIGTSHVFCLHGVLLDGLSVRDARRRSDALMRRRWKGFLLHGLFWSLRILILSVLWAFLAFVLPSLAVGALPLDRETERFLTVFLLSLSSVSTGLASLLVTPWYAIEITRLYREWSRDRPVPMPPRSVKRRPVLAAAGVLTAAGLASLSWAVTWGFDSFFPPEIDTRIIAHRGCGNESTENTVSGLEKAIALGAYGSEIDIQRTADGHYIVNHDPTFLRTAGDGRTPQQMTMEQIRWLRVQGSGDPVATLEEMLEAARGRIVLFIELKGVTADRQMCEDTVRIVREMGMEDQVVLISLKYEIIDYIETRWPEMETAYLTFLSYGDAVQLHCDRFGLEEGSATAAAIDAVHAAGKEVLVWTTNTRESQERFLSSRADAIITDEVVQAQAVIDRLERRNDLERILSMFFSR